MARMPRQSFRLSILDGELSALTMSTHATPMFMQTDSASRPEISALDRAGPLEMQTHQECPPRRISPLEYALTKNAPATPLECTLTKSLDLKPRGMNTYKKQGGGGAHQRRTTLPVISSVRCRRGTGARQAASSLRRCYNPRSMRSPKLRARGVVVLGDINIDILARIEKFPAPGEDCLAPQLEMHCGGVGANTALALARWGVPVRLLGSVGHDAFGELALRFLRAGQVDVTRVAQRDHAATGLMFIAVTADGQRTIFGSRGANAELQGPPTEAGGLEDAQAVHLVGYNFLSPSVAELAGRLIEEAHRNGRQVSLDVGMAPSRQIPQKILQVAGKVDILFAGLDEAAGLTGKPDKAGAFDALERSGAREVVMKLGEKGF